jgi:hypothetical protein
MDADDRAAVTLVSNRIHRLLERDPHSQGESRAGIERFWIERPLAVAYEIHEAEQKVLVLSFRPAQSRP